MTFKQYRDRVLGTAFYPRTLVGAEHGGSETIHLPVYPAMALCGEAGEAAELVKKAWRDGTPLDQRKYLRELGDCLWYIMAAAEDVGSNLQEVAQLNIEKLEDRRARGKLFGSGDDR